MLLQVPLNGGLEFDVAHGRWLGLIGDLLAVLAR